MKTVCETSDIGQLPVSISLQQKEKVENRFQPFRLNITRFSRRERQPKSMTLMTVLFYGHKCL